MAVTTILDRMLPYIGSYLPSVVVGHYSALKYDNPVSIHIRSVACEIQDL